MHVVPFARRLLPRRRCCLAQLKTGKPALCPASHHPWYSGLFGEMTVAVLPTSPLKLIFSTCFIINVVITIAVVVHLGTCQFPCAAVEACFDLTACINRLATV